MLYPEGYITFELPPWRKTPPPTGFNHLTESRTIPKGWNVGVQTNNFCGIDIDNQALIPRFEDKYGKHGLDCITTIVATPRGGRHYYGSNLVRNEQNDGWDVRGVDGYLAGVTSRTREGIYRCLTEIVPVSELREFPAELFGRKQRVAGIRNHTRTQIEDINNLDAYIDGVIARYEGRHNTTFKLACRLCDAGRSEIEAFALMIEWNRTNADPPWTTRELLHKVKDAFNRKGPSNADQREERQEVREV
jgi:hypothetical protein